MLGKRKSSAPLPPPKKRRKPVPTIEEIRFDASAREDYLTGFHKRKLQRIKNAKEEAAKKEREERVQARKQLRERRKVDLEKHVEEVNALVREAAKAAGEIDQDEEEEEEEEGEEEEEEEEEDGQAEGEQVNVLAEATTIDHEAEFIDEDLYTTVTVEAVDISKDGLHKVAQEEEVSDDESNKPAAGRPSTRQGAKRIWTKERPNGPKKKKKPFRYESKAERKMTRFKERSGNKSKAKVRKE